MDELLTLEEARKILKYSLSTIRMLVKTGKLKGQRIGNEYRIKKEDLEAFIEGKPNA